MTAQRAPMQVGMALNDSRDLLRAMLVQVMGISHQGRANGIRADLLAGLLGITDRLLRSLISDARTEGTAIVGTPETGYYIAQTGDELEECCRFLRSRALHSLTIEARLRRVALPELLGQLKVNT